MPKQLWAPWRMQYIEAPKAGGDCIFCGVRAASATERRERLVLASGEHAFVILNRYPYTSGHLMVVPHSHATRLDELPLVEHDVLFRWLRAATARLLPALDAQALNVGINLGVAAGASQHAHLHVHVVPRWEGDHNFMAVVGEVRVIPQALDATWAKLRPAFADLDEPGTTTETP
ncbi:MAG: HIT domain-containing protein [Polyangiaceae bacterium]|nr:HIT domain-containing protein [Polyangiaceae bacterium]